MNKIFTLLLSAAFCTASPVFAMDPPPVSEQELPNTKTIILKSQSYYKGKTVPPIPESLQRPEPSLEIKVPEINDSVMKTLAKGVKSHTRPFALEVHSGATLTAEGIAFLAKMIGNNNLTNLTIYHFKDTTKFPLLLECLDVCPHLREGNFASDFLREEDTRLLSRKFPFLKRLDLGVMLPNIQFLQTLSQLTYLKLSNCKLGGDTDFQTLSYLTNLHTLNLHSNNIKNNATQLTVCPSLTDINLSSNSITNSDVLNIAKDFIKLPKLKILNLATNEEIADDGILAVAQLTQVEELNLFRNLMTDEGGKRLAEVLGTRFDSQNFRQTPIQTNRLKINVAYNKMTRPLRTSLQETLNSSVGTSVEMTW